MVTSFCLVAHDAAGKKGEPSQTPGAWSNDSPVKASQSNEHTPQLPLLKRRRAAQGGILVRVGWVLFEVLVFNTPFRLHGRTIKPNPIEPHQ